jgi:AcrR family transcriptional regulator
MSKQRTSLETLLVIPPENLRRKPGAKTPAKKRPLTPTVNEADRMRQIYYVAARLFCEKGYEATSMSDIAEAIGFTKAAIYHFIPGGKQDLLNDIISFGMNSLERQVIEPARQIADPETRLRAIIDNHVRIITDGSATVGFNPVTVVVDEVAGLSAAQRRKITLRKRVYVDLIRETLSELQTQGKLKDVDVTVAAFSLLAMILWLARWYRPNGKLTGKQVAEEIAKLVLSGLLMEPSRSRKKS